jgi:hypothetical protein
VRHFGDTLNVGLWWLFSGFSGCVVIQDIFRFTKRIGRGIIHNGDAPLFKIIRCRFHHHCCPLIFSLIDDQDVAFHKVECTEDKSQTPVHKRYAGGAVIFFLQIGWLNLIINHCTESNTLSTLPNSTR